MSKPNISQLIEEARQSLREIATMAARPGKEQALNQHRMALRQATLDLLVWCQGNSDEIREYRKAKGQGDE